MNYTDTKWPSVNWGKWIMNNCKMILGHIIWATWERGSQLERHSSTGHHLNSN